jgi:transposase
MQNGHPTYTKAFKVEAVKLAETSGKSKTQIAQDLGISDSSLSRWCQQYGEHGEQAFPGSGHQQPEQEEIRQLKRELEVVRMERDILKKAIAIFSRLPQ